MWLWLGITILIVGILCLLRSEYERNHFVTETFSLTSEKINQKKRTFVFLTDLHSKEFGNRNIRLLQAIDKCKPDAILIGGDMMVCGKKSEVNVKEVLELIKVLAEKYPVFYGSGNHESRMNRKRERHGEQYDIYRSKLKEMGITYLSDASVDFLDDIRITSIDLEPRYYKDITPDILEANDIIKKVGQADSKRFQILLSHSPLFFHAYAAWGANLSLAGHFHGGTIRLPFLGGVMTPQYQFFSPWCAGFYHQEEHHLIVGRGLGTHSINIRLNNRPQIVRIDVYSPRFF